jgi:DNA-binding MarR family transcriptional regulator
MPTRTTKAAPGPARKAAARTAKPPARAAAKTGKAAPQPEGHAENAAKVLRRFRMIFNAVKNHFRSVERKAGISGAQLWALSVIRANPGAGMNQLARAMDLHQSTASNLVRALVEAGLVVSAREGDDRRAVQLYVTTKGQRALAKAPGPFTGILPEALMHLDAPTLARLERDLAAVIRQIAPEKQGRNVPMGDPQA